MSMAFKRFFTSFFLLLVMLFFSVSASADMPDSVFGTWMDAAIRAAGITIESTLPFTAPVADILINPFNITDGVYSAINYTFPNANLQTPGQTLESYLQRSHLTIRGDLVTIDGVDYRDIWVDNSFAQACRTNVLDLQTAWEISSNSSGNIASGAGLFDGVPVFLLSDGTLCSNYYVFNSKTSAFVGNSYISFPGDSGGYVGCRYDLSNGVHNTVFVNALPISVSYRLLGSYWYFYANNVRKNIGSSSGLSSLYDSTPFDFDWVSRSIPASTLDSSDGIHFLVPSDPNDFQDEDIRTAVNNFNLSVGDISPNISIDLSTDENYDSLISVINNIAPIINYTAPSYGPYDSVVPPSPTPTPEPTPAPVPWPSPAPTPEPTASPSPEPTAEPTPEPSVVPTAEPSPVPSSPIGETPFTYLNDGLDRLQDTLSQGFHNLIDSFELGEASFFSNVIDSLFDAFQSLFDRIKEVFGIWGYVVAWVGNISAPFNWSLSALGSAGPYFLSPFSAVAAAAIVIAIYRRFGK